MKEKRFILLSALLTLVNVLSASFFLSCSAQISNRCLFNEQNVFLKKHDVDKHYGKPIYDIKEGGSFKKEDAKEWVKYGMLYYEDMYIVYRNAEAFISYMMFYETSNTFTFNGDSFDSQTSMQDVLNLYMGRRLLIDETVCQLYSINIEFYSKNKDQINHILIETKELGMLEMVFFKKKLYSIIIDPQGIW